MNTHQEARLEFRTRCHAGGVHGKRRRGTGSLGRYVVSWYRSTVRWGSISASSAPGSGEIRLTWIGNTWREIGLDEV